MIYCFECEDYEKYYCAMKTGTNDAGKCETCGWNQKKMHERLVERFGEKIANKLERTRLICSEEEDPTFYIKSLKDKVRKKPVNEEEEKCKTAGREFCTFNCSNCGWNKEVGEMRIKKMMEMKKQNGK